MMADENLNMEERQENEQLRFDILQRIREHDESLLQMGRQEGLSVLSDIIEDNGFGSDVDFMTEAVLFDASLIDFCAPETRDEVRLTVERLSVLDAYANMLQNHDFVIHLSSGMLYASKQEENVAVGLHLSENNAVMATYNVGVPNIPYFQNNVSVDAVSNIVLNMDRYRSRILQSPLGIYSLMLQENGIAHDRRSNRLEFRINDISCLMEQSENGNISLNITNLTQNALVYSATDFSTYQLNQAVLQGFENVTEGALTVPFDARGLFDDASYVVTGNHAHAVTDGGIFDLEIAENGILNLKVFSTLRRGEVLFEGSNLSVDDVRLIMEETRYYHPFRTQDENGQEMVYSTQNARERLSMLINDATSSNDAREINTDAQEATQTQDVQPLEENKNEDVVAGETQKEPQVVSFNQEESVNEPTETPPVENMNERHQRSATQSENMENAEDGITITDDIEKREFITNKSKLHVHLTDKAGRSGILFDTINKGTYKFVINNDNTVTFYHQGEDGIFRPKDMKDEYVEEVLKGVQEYFKLANVEKESNVRVDLSQGLLDFYNKRGVATDLAEVGRMTSDEKGRYRISKHILDSYLSSKDRNENTDNKMVADYFVSYKHILKGQEQNNKPLELKYYKEEDIEDPVKFARIVSRDIINLMNTQEGRDGVLMALNEQLFNELPEGVDEKAKKEGQLGMLGQMVNRVRDMHIERLSVEQLQTNSASREQSQESRENGKPEKDSQVREETARQESPKPERRSETKSREAGDTSTTPPVQLPSMTEVASFVADRQSFDVKEFADYFSLEMFKKGGGMHPNLSKLLNTSQRLGLFQKVENGVYERKADADTILSNARKYDALMDTFIQNNGSDNPLDLTSITINTETLVQKVEGDKSLVQIPKSEATLYMWIDNEQLVSLDDDKTKMTFLDKNATYKCCDSTGNPLKDITGAKLVSDYFADMKDPTNKDKSSGKDNKNLNKGRKRGDDGDLGL